MKGLLALVLIAGFAAVGWRMLSQPVEPDREARPAPMFAYGVGLIREIDTERGFVTLQHGPLSAVHMDAMTMSYSVEDKRSLAGLRPMEKVEFQLRHDGNDYLVTDIESRRDEGDEAGVLPACAFKHSGRASLSQTASARSAAPPRAT